MAKTMERGSLRVPSDLTVGSADELVQFLRWLSHRLKMPLHKMQLRDVDGVLFEDADVATDPDGTVHVFLAVGEEDSAEEETLAENGDASRFEDVLAGFGQGGVR